MIIQLCMCLAWAKLAGNLVGGESLTATGWLIEALQPGAKGHTDVGTASKTYRGHFNASTLPQPRPQPTGPAWEIDNERLHVRLKELVDARRQQEEAESRTASAAGRGGGGNDKTIGHPLPWPLGSVDYDLAVGVDHTWFAQDPRKRCEHLSRPTPAVSASFPEASSAASGSSSTGSRKPVARAPIAVLLTGQLRTAEVTIPFLEENLIRASAPHEVHVFAHVWALRQAKDGSKYLKGSYHKQKDASTSTASTDSPGDAAAAAKTAAALAGVRAEARLRRMRGLKAIVVEEEDHFDSIVCAFYDARYGAGWCERRHVNQLNFFVTATATFLSQWYKVSAAHGLARRWYRKQALKAAGLATGGGGAGDEATRDGGADGATDGRPSDDDAVDERAFTATTSFGDYLPPLAIVRLRPDHLLTVSWNLTRAAMEFSGRAAAAASGGNFLALWGPTSHSETCGPMICPNAKAKSPKPKLSPLSQEGRTLLDETGTAKPPPVPLEAAGARRKCYSNGRLDDGFAFGTPQAMDGYAAPYHPYQSKCCEEYVTSTLPLAGLTQVGSAHSAGGIYGVLGMPGSCHHRMGHYPLRFKPLLLPPRNDSSSTSSATSMKHHRRHYHHYRPSAPHKPTFSTQPGFLEYSTSSSSSTDEPPNGVAADAAASSGSVGDSADPHAPEFPLVPGPFWGYVANAGLISHSSGKAREERLRARQSRERDRGSGSGTSRGHGSNERGEGRNGSSGESVDDRLRTSHGHVRAHPYGNSLHENRNGLEFAHMCAPVYYFNKAGCQILRFRDAVKESTEEAQALAKGGACPPHMKRDPPTSGLFRNSRKHGGGDNSGGGDGENRSQATCSDTRAMRMAQDLKHYLHPSKSPCDCIDPVVLTDLLPHSRGAQNGATAPSGSSSGLSEGTSADQSAMRNAFAVHCAHATGFEGRACGGIVK